MGSIVVVALPDEDEPVWDLSSEKKPHMTLLYMNGPLKNLENTIQFIQHAAETSLSQFGLSVDRRGTLGQDDADVLFFATDHGIPKLRAFRAQLLTNEDIAKNWLKEDQFPGWIPHLTMGYPHAPAKKAENKYDLNWINFSRIAVWTSNFDGPEFDLKSGAGLALADDIAWSDDDLTAENWSEEHGVYIMQSGVKGMKWGVRKKDGSGTVETLGVAPLQGPLETRVGLRDASGNVPKFDKSSFKEHNKALQSMVKELRGVPGSPGTFVKSGSNMQQYFDKIRKTEDLNKIPNDKEQKTFLDGLGKAMTKDAQTLAPDGSEALVVTNGDGAAVLFLSSPKNIKEIKDMNDIKHDVLGQNEVPSVILEFDLDGRLVTGIKDVIEHADMSDDEYLAHYGRMGMRWGVRRPTGSDGLVKGSVSDAVKSNASPEVQKALDGVKGVKGRKSSSDHKQMKKNLEKRVDQLSTKEITDLTKRIQAVKNLQAETAAQKEAKKGKIRKIVAWGANATISGLSKEGEKYIQELVGKQLRGVLPNSDGFGPAKTKKAKEAADKEAADNAKKSRDRDFERQEKAKDEALKNLANAIVDLDGVADVSSLPKRKD